MKASQLRRFRRMQLGTAVALGLCGWLAPQLARADAPDAKPRNAGAVCADGRSVAVSLPRNERAEEPPLREDELPWCVSADDPRCAPLQKDAAPHALSFALRAAAPATEDSPSAAAPDASREEDFSPGADGGPRPGFAHRIERPPRSGRRLG